MLNNITTLVYRAHVKLVLLSQTLRRPTRLSQRSCACVQNPLPLHLPPEPLNIALSLLYPPPPAPRFSSGVGMPDIQKLKEATELRSRLQTVSGAGGQELCRNQGQGEGRLPSLAWSQGPYRILSFDPTVLRGLV